jgi:REP element-mobilizing transposase RayT
LERYRLISSQEPPFHPTDYDRNIILQAFIQAAEHREWILYAVHIRTTHIHLVIKSKEEPGKTLAYIKARASSSLKKTNARKHFWTYHGSTRYLWNEHSLSAAVDYVLNGQGQPMTRYAGNLVGG